MSNLKRWVIAATAIVAFVGSSAAVSVAQQGPVSSCDGDVVGTWPGTGFGRGGVAGVFAGPASRPTQQSVAASIPAGTYDVSAVTYDGYVDRSSTTPAQDFEQLFLEFLDSGGSVLATSGNSADLQSGVDEATWAGSLGRVTLGAEAVVVRATHAFAGQPIGTQSLMPSCFGLSLVSTTTTTTTTVPDSSTTVPDSTTTIAPPTTAVPPSTTIAPPTTVGPPTSTTVPVQVLPVVQQVPDPDPVTAVPNFTG